MHSHLATNPPNMHETLYFMPCELHLEWLYSLVLYIYTCFYNRLIPCIYIYKVSLWSFLYLQLQLRMASYEKAKEAGDPSPAKSVERMRGYYRCCMYKWAKSRRKENWPLICRACPRIAKKNKELPDILRKFMGVQSKFKSRAPTRDQCEYTNILPPEFEEIVAESVAAGFKNQRKRFFCCCFGSVGFCRYCLSGGGLENFYLYLDIVIDIYIYVYIYRWISLLFLTSKITTFQNEAQIDVLLTGCAGLRIHKTQKNATVSPALGPSHCWNSAATWSGQLDRRKGPDEKSRLELCDVIDRWTKSHQSKFKGNWKKYLDLIHLIFFLRSGLKVMFHFRWFREMIVDPSLK